MVIETERLLMREITQSDYGVLSMILQDEQTMYSYNGAFSDEETLQWLDKQLTRYDKYGFGLWAVILKDTSEMIGQCGLTIQDWNGREVLEVGYQFNRKFWHNGYATEAAKSCIDYAFKVLNASEVTAIIRDTNISS